MNFPQTNGFAYTLASAHIDLNGRRYVGINTIKWQHAMEGAEMVPGASLVSIAETPGMYKATCEFEILWTEYVALVRGLGSGYMMRRFNIGAQVMDNGAGLSSLFIPSARIISVDGGLESKAATKNVKCSVMGVITIDGISPVLAGASSGGGNVFGGSASVVASVGASVSASVGFSF